MNLYRKAIILAVAALTIVVFFLFGIGLGGDFIFLKTSPWRWVFLVGDIAGAIASTLLISNLLNISKPGSRSTLKEIRDQVSLTGFGLSAIAICLGATTRLLV